MTSVLRHPEAEQRRQAVAAFGTDEVVHVREAIERLLSGAPAGDGRDR